MKYIFIDVDGTICYRNQDGQKVIPKKTMETLRKLQNDGNKLFLATGRSYFSAKEVIDNFNFDGYVASLGAYVRTKDKVIVDNPFKDEELQEIYDLANKYNIMLLYECLDLIFVDNKWIENLKKFRDQTDFSHWRDLKTYEKDIKVYKVMVKSNDKDSFLAFEYEISKKYSVVHGTNQKIYLAEIGRGNNSKGHGIKNFMASENVAYEDVIAIGDSPNDADMLLVAKTSIAMGNSFKIIKDSATMVTDEISEDGFYKAFKKLGMVE